MEIKQAMILAACMGTRMRPITDSIPKPMVSINNKTLIERIIDDLYSFGISKIVVNTYYKADVLENFLIQKYSDKKDKLEIVFSKEIELLDSGGGINKALLDNKLNKEPFIVLNSDMIYEKVKKEKLLELVSSENKHTKK